MNRNRIRTEVERIITGPGTGGVVLLKTVLSLAALGYGSGMMLRRALYRSGRLPSRELPCRVVSIGNITLGGTGKTPMTLYLARLLHRLGLRPAVISRGYRGGAEKEGGVVSDGSRLLLDPAAAGDEPVLMARHLPGIPVVVGKDRIRAGRIATARFGADVVLLDDAFQHLRVKRSFDCVLLDAAAPLGNGRLLPRGPLREPVSALERADVLILTRTDAPGAATGWPEVLKHRRSIRNKPVFRTVHRPYAYAAAGGPESLRRPETSDPDCLRGRRAFAFSGIARNDEFHRTVEGFGCRLVGRIGFGDHHPYTAKDLEAVFRAAERAGADRLVTTEKDLVRLGGAPAPPLEMIAVGVEISFGKDTDRFERFVGSRFP
jgi:tetraacyldisaccharide 4'-kinase